MKIIAEMGVNYQSDREVIEMLNYCEDLGIKYVKFQLFEKHSIPEELRHCYIDKIRAEKFYNAGKKRGIEVFFSCMYPEAIDICEAIGVKYYKIRYMDRNNLILYRKLKKVKDIKDKIIFVSCQAPKDTIFANMAKYQRNVKFLYCVPQYPAQYKDYIYYPYESKENIYTKIPNLNGISDHTSDLELFKIFKKAYHNIKNKWFEMHVCINKKEAYEGLWSKTFEELKKVL